MVHCEKLNPFFLLTKKKQQKQKKKVTKKVKKGNMASRSSQQYLYPISTSAFTSSTQSVEAFRHTQKTERVVRLEIQRRSVKESIRTHEMMERDIDERLAYIAEFKRGWLARMKDLELERQEVVAREHYQRGLIEEELAAEYDRLKLSVKSGGARGGVSLGPLNARVVMR